MKQIISNSFAKRNVWMEEENQMYIWWTSSAKPSQEDALSWAVTLQGLKQQFLMSFCMFSLLIKALMLLLTLLCSTTSPEDSSLENVNAFQNHCNFMLSNFCTFLWHPGNSNKKIIQLHQFFSLWRRKKVHKCWLGYFFLITLVDIRGCWFITILLNYLCVY